MIRNERARSGQVELFGNEQARSGWMVRHALAAIWIAALGAACTSTWNKPAAPDPAFPCGSPRWEFCPAAMTPPDVVANHERTCCPMDHVCREGGWCAFVGDPDFRNGVPGHHAGLHQKKADGSWVKP